MEYLNINSELQSIHRFLVRFTLHLGITVGVGIEEERNKQDNEWWTHPRTKLVFEKLSYGYSLSHGCLDLRMYHYQVTGRNDLSSSGTLDRYRIFDRSTRLGQCSLEPVDLYISAFFPDIHPIRSYRHCNNPCCLNPNFVQWVDYVADRYLCETCQNAYLLSEPSLEVATDNPKDPKQVERAKLTPKMRFQILERDGFKCRACGRNPREHNVVLHVDHIVAIDNGGKTEHDNLHTLCRDCNLAKSNKVVKQMTLW